MGIVRDTKAWPDEDILEVLHMRDNLGLSAQQIAKKTGRTRNGIIGLWNRINKALADDTEIGNGTMPAEWWRR